jgi:hypothetical protein
MECEETEMPSAQLPAKVRPDIEDGRSEADETIAERHVVGRIETLLFGA